MAAARLGNRLSTGTPGDSDERKSNQRKRHQLTLKNRELLYVEGVTNVESFDDRQIVLETDQGGLVVRGENLHIKELNVEAATLTVEGVIATMEYLGELPGKKAKGLFGRLVR